MDLHFIDQNGNHFVVPDAPGGYERKDATLIDPPPTPEHRWMDGGWRIPEPEPEPVPQSVTRAQGKAALIQQGLWDAVVAFVDGIEDPTEKALADVALNDTLEWQRTSPFLNAAAAALGLTDERLDDLFRMAATIEL